MPRNIVIIGGGPGGYVAAIRAAQLGAQVTLIERDTLGGTCTNRGCIPTKVLLQSANVLAQVRNSLAFGISLENVSVDFSAITQRKQAIIKRLTGGITTLIRRNKVHIVKGTGFLIDSKTVGILGTNERLNADSIIIATGAKSSTISIEGMSMPGIMTSDDALTMERFPKTLIIIGGGVIGLELAQIMCRMGSEVTIIEIMSQILPNEDTETAGVLMEILKKEGIEIFTNAHVSGIKNSKQKGKVITFKLGDSRQDQERVADAILLAVGRQPNTDDLGVSKLGLAMDGVKVIVNDHMQTNIPGIYAVGDVVGGLMLAHVAMEEGKCAAENSLGGDYRMDYTAVPRCVYTFPEIAGVGLTEGEAKEQYGNIKVGRFPFIANAKSLIVNTSDGMVKIIADARYGQILGVHIVGPQATELIAEAVLAIRMEATLEDIASVIYAHPTLSEAVMEAALGAEGKAIHI